MTIVLDNAGFPIGVGKGSAIFFFTGIRISVQVVESIATRPSKDDYKIFSAPSLYIQLGKPYLVPTRGLGYS